MSEQFPAIYLMPRPPKAPTKPTLRNRVRIIGGEWRSRVIEFPDAEGLRPTPNRVRETLFNWLGQTLHGTHCLDLFAGSGALGFEAASRGAAEVVMIEAERGAFAALKQNKQRLAADVCHVVANDALRWLNGANQRFDIIFVDPPFASGLMPKLLPMLAGMLNEGGLIYAEWGEPLPQTLARHAISHLTVVKEGKAGASHFALLSAKPNAREA